MYVKQAIITILLAMLLVPVSIEAKKKVKQPEVPQLMNYPNAEISEYRLHGGNVVIRGNLVVPESAKGEKVPQEALDQFNGRFTVIVRDYIVRKEKTSVIEFKNDGTFSLNVYVPSLCLYSSIHWERHMLVPAILSTLPLTRQNGRKKRA